MITIDEAIERMEHKAILMNSTQAKEEWLILAGYLYELKELRKVIHIDESYLRGKSDGVDEFADALCCQACFTNEQKDAIRNFANNMKGRDFTTIGNREFVKLLLQFMSDNPTLDVLCKVDSDIVAEYGYDWWLGKLATQLGIKLDEYSDCIGETIKFRSDDDYEEWMEELYDIDEFEDVPDNEWSLFCKYKVNKLANWKRAIIISVTTL